jgi:hypothetical protein
MLISESKEKVIIAIKSLTVMQLEGTPLSKGDLDLEYQSCQLFGTVSFLPQVPIF